MMKPAAKNIGLIGAVAIGIGGMVGGGIFAVLGEAVSISHGATPIAFLIAGIVALLTAVSYARLSVTYQSRGGTAFFIDAAFGNNFLSGSLNLILWLSYLVTISLYAVAFASYAGTFMHGHGSVLSNHLLISAAILLPMLINLLGASFVSKSETMIVALKILLLIAIIIFSLPYINLQHVAPQHWGSVNALVSAGMTIFVAYEGFELIANSAEEIADPERNLPRAFIISVVLVIALYIVIATITVSTVPEAQLAAAKDFALAVAARPALGQTGFILVAIAALLATFSAINATIYGNARLGYLLAKDGQLPQAFDKECWNKPVMGVLITSAISLLIANSIDLSEIAILGSAGFLLVFSLVNVSAFKLRQKIGGYPWVYLSAFVMSTLSLGVLLVHTYHSDQRAVLTFAGFIVISVLFELVYGRYVRSHFLGRGY